MNNGLTVKSDYTAANALFYVESPSHVIIPRMAGQTFSRQEIKQRILQHPTATLADMTEGTEKTHIRPTEVLGNFG